MGAAWSASPSTASSARSSSGTLPSWMMRAGRRCTRGRSTTIWKEAGPFMPSRWTTCWLVSTYEVSPSTATTTPLAERSTLPRETTSTRTLWRRAFCTTLPLSLLASAGRARRANATTAVRKVNVPPLLLPCNQQYKEALAFPKALREKNTAERPRDSSATLERVFQRAGSALTIVVGFFVGLLLASLNHILPADSI